MTRSGAIARRFAERRAEGRAALVPYVTAGYPDMDVLVALLGALSEAGADVVELGVPFSDPVADGPTIQRASFQALERGATLDGVLGALERFREGDDTPVVLFTYLNPVLRRGVPAFVARAREAGADGVLLTDLPAGSDDAIEDAVREGGLDLIRLLAPTTTPERARRVVEGATGFLYYISRTGVTGARSELRGGLAREVGALRALTDLPVAVGFGISTPAQAAEVAAAADGVVVGSALVEALGEGGVDGAAAFLASLREAVDGVVRPEPSG